MLTIYGIPVSHHTRKVRLAALEKGIDFRLEPVVPLKPPNGWAKLSPTGKIPALTDGDFALADSSVICAYLERKVPSPSIYPAETESYARALWIEEYVDGSLQEHVLRGVLFETVFGPKFVNHTTNRALVEQNINEVVPGKLDYLEQYVADLGDVDSSGFLVGNALSIADITVASILVHWTFAGQRVDPKRYPRLEAHLRRMLGRPSFKRALAEEKPIASDIGGLDLWAMKIAEAA